MKLFVLGWIVLANQTYCTGQTAGDSTRKLYRDTIRLSTPKLGLEEATNEDFIHCIELNTDGYTLSINGKRYYALTESDLSTIVKTNRKEIIKRRLNLIVASKTSYTRIIRVLDIMTDQEITQYKLLTDGDFSDPVPLVVFSGSPPQKALDPNDSTVLVIWVTRDYRDISFLNKNQRQTKIEELDNFLTANQSKIDPLKIVVSAPGDATFQMIDPIEDILRKHGYNKYQLDPKN